MTDFLGRVWESASKIVDERVDKVKVGSRIALEKSKYLTEDTKCAKDWFEWIRAWDTPSIGTCEFIDRHLLDEASVTMLTTLVIHVDEDGVTAEDEEAVCGLMERIERSNHLMTRWEKMIETQLVRGVPGNSLLVDPTRLVHYIREMGLPNPWEEQYEK